MNEQERNGMKTKWPTGARVMNLHSGILGIIVERDGRSLRVQFDDRDSMPIEWDVSQVGAHNVIVSEDFQHDHGDIKARVNALMSIAEDQSFQAKFGGYVSALNGKDSVTIWRCSGKTRIGLLLFGLEVDLLGIGASKAEALEDLQKQANNKTTATKGSK